MTTSWKVEPVDLAHADDALRSAVTRLASTNRVESLPDDEPCPDEEIWFGMSTSRPNHVRHNLVVWDDDRAALLGSAALEWDDYEDNREMCGLDIDVPAAARRRGIGASLARAALQIAQDNDRTLVNLYAADKVRAGWGFLAAIGAEPKLTERYSVARFADVDRAQLEGWVERAAERAADYRLVRWDGACPDEYVDAFVAEQAVMNTAPVDDLEWEPEVYSVTRLRDREAVIAARGISTITLIAVHEPSGAFAGHSDVWMPKLWPERAYQNDTGVDPAHRNKGLGRWLKAQMLLNLFDERPQVTAIGTWNAGSNDAMLGINYAIGFKTLGEFTDHQVRAGVALSRLEALPA